MMAPPKGVVYTAHLKLRVKLRSIPSDLPRRIYQTAKERYFDAETKLFIAIGRAKYKSKRREFAVVYEETAMTVRIITIHPLKLQQKAARIQSGRWQELE